jgi:hypothetical protein
VLRSHFKLVRALLAVAMFAVVGLSIALVIVANDHDQITGSSAVRPAESIRYGGFNPATGRPESAPLARREHPLQSNLVTGSRDSGPNEGARGKDYSKNAATGDFGGDAPESQNGPGARTD